MVNSKKICLYFILMNGFVSHTISAMWPELMPPFKPSAQAQFLIDTVGNARVFFVSNPDDLKLSDLDVQKIAIYRNALAEKDYPIVMQHELKVKILRHHDVLEAVLVSAEEARKNSRSDYITTLFFGAIQAGDLRSIKFFLDRGLKINEINYFGVTPLAFANARGTEEIKNFLMAQGRQLNQP